MNKKKSIEIIMIIVFSAISALALLCIPFVNVNSNGINGAFGYVVAVLFWLGIILETVFFAKLNHKRKQTKLQTKDDKATAKAKHRCGLVSFFSNTKAVVFDILLLVAIVFIAIIIIFKILNVWVVMSSLAVGYFSLQMHCLFNGKNYFFYRMSSNLSEEEEKNAKVEN